MRKNLGKLLALLVGIAIFAIVLSRLDAGKIAGIISGASPYPALLALAIVFFGVFLKGIKWRLLLSLFCKMQVGILDASKYFLIGFFLSIPTPGRVGDLARAFYVRKQAGLGQGLSTVVFDRLIDITVLLFFGIVSAFLFSSLFGMEVFSLPLAVLAIACFFALVFLFLRKGFAKAALRPFFRAFVPEGFRGKTAEGFEEFFSSLAGYRKGWPAVVGNALLSFLCFALSFAVFWLVCFSLGLNVSLLFVILAVSIAALAEIIPITVSGIGVREGLLVFLFSFIGVSAETAFAVSILYYILGYVSVAIVGFFVFLKEPIKLGDFLRH